MLENEKNQSRRSPKDVETGLLGAGGTFEASADPIFVGVVDEVIDILDSPSTTPFDHPIPPWRLRAAGPKGALDSVLVHRIDRIVEFRDSDANSSAN